MLDKIKEQAESAVLELLDKSKIERNEIFVIGCSSSEVAGHDIGTFSSIDIAKSIFEGVYPVIKKRNIYLAAQCCEHLNRAIIIEKECAIKYGLEIVNVIPQPKAGGSFATIAYQNFEKPVAVEEIKAVAGIDIGGTLIGMHLKKVAVPVKIQTAKIGEANIICARTRPKFIGGERAYYDEVLM